jgi:hypothetical protein
MRTHDAREELDYVRCRACFSRIRLAGNWPLNIRYVLAHVPRTGLVPGSGAGRPPILRGSSHVPGKIPARARPARDNLAGTGLYHR